MGATKSDIPAATETTPAGAPVQTVHEIDPAHPALDANPRERTTDEQNRIDLNDPTLTGAEAVAAALRGQADA